jgi:hypothetical protein
LAAAAAEKLKEDTERGARVGELRQRCGPVFCACALQSSDCDCRRLAALQDDARPAAVARRRATGQRTARENINAVADKGTFSECV